MSLNQIRSVREECEECGEGALAIGVTLHDGEMDTYGAFCSEECRAEWLSYRVPIVPEETDSITNNNGP
jgi:hypothetical protein